MRIPGKYLIGLVLILTLLIGYIGLDSFDINDRSKYVEAKVLSIEDEQLQEDSLIPNLYLGYQQLKVQILAEDLEDEVYYVKNSLSRLYNVHTETNMHIILKLDYKDNQLANISVFNYKRSHIILLLCGLFFIALLVFGKLNGLKAIVSLVFTGVMLVFFMLPLIFRGYDPVMTAILTISIITFISLLLVSGPNKKTASAVMGTILGVTCAGIISYIAGNAAHLSGLTMNQAEELIYISENTQLQVRGLMFATILIASLGAIMDVAMSISSSIFEFNTIDPTLSKKMLFSSGMNVGKDVMGTMSNTLILAFAGGSLNVLLLIMAYKMPSTQIFNLDLIATEVIQGLAGSIGIVLTVPITGLISVVLLKESGGVSKEKKE